MANPKGEVAFAYEGDDYTLLFDFEAIEYFERHCGSIGEFARQLEAAQAGGAVPKISPMVRLLLAGLQHYHPEVGGDVAMKMLMADGVQAQLFEGFGAAMPDAGAGGNGAAPKGARSGKKARTGTG